MTPNLPNRPDDPWGAQADAYRRHRPTYPAALFDHLAAVAPGRDLAVDCGTGSGQAALALAQRFARVVATDVSDEQVRRAPTHSRVEYRVGPAERISLPDASADLVTVAAALHWFDLDAFYAEARRVLRAHGVLAAWSYWESEIDPVVDAILMHHAEVRLGPYWLPGITHNRTGYETLPFPFPRLPEPMLYMEATWDLAELVAYVETWSASREYHRRHGRDASDAIREELRRAWGNPSDRRAVRWPLHLRIGARA